MKDMNIPVEVENALKQLKSDTADSLKSRFVYNVCGYHHTPIPSQLSPKLEFAHPSPLVRLLSAYKRLLSTDNLVLVMAKLSACIRYVYNSVAIRLSIQPIHVSNNLNNSQSGFSTNDTSMNSSNNDYNLQLINIENRLYENKIDNYTYNNMTLMNTTKI